MKISIVYLSLIILSFFISCTEDKNVIEEIPTSIEDYDGNEYQTIRIGNQIWMAENLKVTHYADGTKIPLVTDEGIWANLEDNNLDDAYCYYNNNTNGESDIYGALYTWAAAMNKSNTSATNPSGIQGVCPTGWHLPSSLEWSELMDELGGVEVAGGKLKETGISLWWDPNIGATNESGFSARPGGLRDAWGIYSFYNQGGVGFWWSATETTFSDSLAVSQPLASNQPFADIGEIRKSYGISVRCLKD